MAILHLANEWRFLRSFLAKPSWVPSPVPSGRRLAEAIAARVDLGNHPILELGPGTGSVTEAIPARGVPPSQLVAVERQAAFARLLRVRFAQSTILDRDAFWLEQVLRGAGYPPKRLPKRLTLKRLPGEPLILSGLM